MLDSQSVKAPHAPGGGGYDATQKVKGRKRHIAADMDGRLRTVNLTATHVQDAASAELSVAAVRRRWPWLRHLFADEAYNQGRLMSLAAYKDPTLEVVRKLVDQKGFQFRHAAEWWIFRQAQDESTFGWMGRWCRLVRDYERRCDVSEAMVHVSMGPLLLRRIAHPEP